MAAVAIVGEGVIGCSTALQIAKVLPACKITVFNDRPFSEACSFGPAGLFRVDNEENKEYARTSFAWFSHLSRTTAGAETGVKLISGHIQSDSKERLETQERAMKDIVYNFRWLTDRERLDMFPNPSKYCIHYTAYASEGNLYVPYLKKLLTEKGVNFVQRKVDNLEQLGDEEFDVVINCAGLAGGKLAGDDDSVYPSRGIAIEVEAPWHKHFNYRDFTSFTIPKTNTVVVGTVKQDNRSDMVITDEDRKDIWKRYLDLHPGMKDAKIVSEWVGLRPHRKTIRVEATQKKTPAGKSVTVVHHYGHGSNGFTLGWGTAEKAAQLVKDAVERMTSKL